MTDTNTEVSTQQEQTQDQVESTGGTPVASTTGDYSWVPETFIKDGVPQFEELAKGYSELQKKFSSTRPSAPKSVDEYAFETDVLELDQEATRSFKEEAHKLGLSVDQYKFVMSKYVDYVSAALPSAERAEEDLKRAWGADYQTNLEAANRAWSTYAGDVKDPSLQNNPTFIKLMAKIGLELGEDRAGHASAGIDPGITETEIRDLMARPDYWSRKDLQAKVDSYLQKGGKL